MGYLGFLYTLARGGGRKTAAKALLMPDPAALRLALGGGGAEEWVTVSGTAPLSLPNAAMKAIARLIQYGKVEQDGTPTPDAPVWPVINNGTVGVGATGKNLFGVPIESKLTLNANGELATNSTRSATREFVPVDGGLTYTLSYAQTYNNGVFYYNENKKFLSYIAWGAKPRTFTTPTDARFVRFSFATINELSEVQLELGDTATAYEPYGAGIIVDGTPEVLTVGTQTAVVVNLFAVGDYKDEAEIISGTVTRRVGMKVLDGTEAWSESGAPRYVLTIPNMAVLSGRAEGMCTHFGYAGSTAKTGTYFLTSARRLFFHTYFSSSDDLKEWLSAQYAAGAPVIVLYPLEQPTTEQVAAQPLNTVAGNNVISVTAEVDGIELEAKYAAKKQ